MALIEIGKRGLSTGDRIDFFRTLASWLASGGGRTSVAEAVSNTVDSFSHDEYKTLRPKMELIQREYSSGQTPLFAALAHSDLGFQRQELAILEAAEKSEQLRDAVPSLVEALDIQFKARKLLRGSMTMPLVMAVGLVLMSLGVMIFMLPMVIGPVLERKPEALAKFPLVLQWYWFASVWLRENYIIPTLVAIFPFAVMVLRNVDPVKRWVDKFLIWFSPSRRLIYSFNAVLTVFFMPALAKSGMPGHQVLDTLAECVSHPSLQNIIRGAARDHESGVRMSEALKPLPFRTSFVNAVSTGERTGDLAERVADLREPFQVDMERQIRQTVSTLKFLVMAILFPFFIISTYTSLVGPIFALMEY